MPELIVDDLEKKEDDESKGSELFEGEFANLESDLDASIANAKKEVPELNLEENTKEPEKQEDNTGDTEPVERGVKIGNKTYSRDELAELVDKAENVKKFNRANTERAQAIAEQKKAIEAKLSEINKLRDGVKGDAEMEKLVDLVADMQTTLAKDREVIASFEETKKEIEDRKYFESLRADAKKTWGIELPEVGTPEFIELVKERTNGNGLVQAYLAKNGGKIPEKKSKPNLKQLPRQSVAPTTKTVDSAVESQIRSLAEAMGRDPDRVLQYAK